MKKVSFIMEEFPKISYARHERAKELRDIYAKYLFKYCYKKLGSPDFTNELDVKNYIILILEKALELNRSERELERLENLRAKLPFLFYGTKDDESIHSWFIMFLSLCNKRKKSVTSLVINHPMYDQYGNKLNFRKDLDWEYLQAMREDIASLTKKCIRTFLHEMRTIGRILTSDELPENDQFDDDEQIYAEDKLELTRNSKANAGVVVDTFKEDSYSDDDKPNSTAAVAVGASKEDSYADDEFEVGSEDNKPSSNS